MKKTIISFPVLLFLTGLIAWFPALNSGAQYALTTDTYTGYCSHLKEAERQSREYYTPLYQDPLLACYDVHFYWLDLVVENDTVYLSGNVTIVSTVTSVQLDTFALELTELLTVDSVFINDKLHSHIHEGEMIYIPLSSSFGKGDTVRARVRYHGTPPSGGFYSGINTAFSSKWGKNVTWTLSEPYAAKDWWPTKQDLTDKADSCWVFLTTDDGNLAGSQGLLASAVPLPGNRVRYEWKSRYPIDYYLISFAVADYQEYTFYAYPNNGPDSLLIQNYIYDSPGCLSNYQEGIDRTADFISLFSDLFGPYPFPEEKYGHCLTELGGGMEHQTMTTIGGFSFSLVAHELGHMWFGDNITCATWSDIYVNEGFATYSDYLAHSFLADPIYDSIWLKVRHDHVKSQPGGSVYIPTDELDNPSRIFDGRLSYSKGALLNHMVRFELQDDDLFFGILKEFNVRFGDSVATGMDFKELVENVSGKDFTGFFDQWYFGEGYPIYDMVWGQEEDVLMITSTQTTSTTVTPLFRMHIPFLIEFDDGTDSTILLYQSENLENFAVWVGKTVENVMVDPDQWVLHKLNSINLGIEETSKPVHFTLGPNPAGDYLTVFLSDRQAQDYIITVSDASGRRLISGSSEAGGRTALDISYLKPGVYFVRVSDGINSEIKKLIRK